jgi:DNA polymerase-3 subunit epsilon
MRYIFLDTETTGLDPKNGDRIIEIGCIEMNERNISTNTFHEYLHPERTVPQEAINIHGITNEFLVGKPLFKEKAQQFIEYIKGSTVIIHNASFDVGFLDAELARLNLMPFNSYVYQVIDSLKEARTLYPGRKNSLDALCDRLEIDRSNREYHGALLDCTLLAKVWLAMTRGQDDLLASNTSSNSTSGNKEELQIANVHDNGIVLNAKAEELNEHERLLQKFKISSW